MIDFNPGLADDQDRTILNGHVVMACNDCGAAIYYDSRDEQYHHLDPHRRRKGCFLIPVENEPPDAVVAAAVREL